MKRVALYCRVSSDEQKEKNTIENQREILQTFIEMKEGLEVYNEYLDNGISGTIPFEVRNAGSSLIEDAKNSLFDIVLVWKIDRFGRDTLTGLSTVEILRKYDIEIMSVTEPFDLNTPTGRFQFITYLNMAELERNNILDRMYLGATRAAKKGKWLGGIVPYGYSKNTDGYLEIDEKESKVIKNIFDMYINKNMSSIDIAVYLNNSNVQSSYGSNKNGRHSGTAKWRANSINRILGNTTYMGIHTYGKRGNRRKELIIREVPAIVSKEIFDLAQDVKKKNTLVSTRNMKNRFFLLRGLITCKHCGRTFYGVTYKKDNSCYYVCSGKRAEVSKIFGKCIALNLNANDIETAVWDDICDIVNNHSKYINAMVNKIDSTNSKELQDSINGIEQSINQIQMEKHSIMQLYRKKLIDDADVEMQLSEIKHETDKLTKILDQYKSELKILEDGSIDIKTIEDKLKYYKDRLYSMNDNEKYDLVKLLVKSIAVEVIDGIKFDVRVVYNIKLDTCTFKGS